MSDESISEGMRRVMLAPFPGNEIGKAVTVGQRSVGQRSVGQRSVTIEEASVVRGQAKRKTSRLQSKLESHWRLARGLQTRTTRQPSCTMVAETATPGFWDVLLGSTAGLKVVPRIRFV